MQFTTILAVLGFTALVAAAPGGDWTQPRAAPGDWRHPDHQARDHMVTVTDHTPSKPRAFAVHSAHYKKPAGWRRSLGEEILEVEEYA